MKYIEEDNRIYVVDNDKEVAEITFTHAGETMYIIDHTLVDQEYRGQKIAEKLVKMVVDKAIENDKLIIPLCPFAAKEFSRNKDYQKVLKK